MAAPALCSSNLRGGVRARRRGGEPTGVQPPMPDVMKISVDSRQSCSSSERSSFQLGFEVLERHHQPPPGRT
jgi:hypothetical protein